MTSQPLDGLHVNRIVWMIQVLVVERLDWQRLREAMPRQSTSNTLTEICGNTSCALPSLDNNVQSKGQELCQVTDAELVQASDVKKNLPPMKVMVDDTRCVSVRETREGTRAVDVIKRNPNHTKLQDRKDPSHQQVMR